LRGGRFGHGDDADARELYVEHLVSQARNEVSDVKLDGARFRPAAR